MRLDYAAIRQRVSIGEVLQLIGFRPTTVRQDQWRGRCPLCRVEGSPLDGSDCFSVHVTDNLFHCFRCHRSGNALDLWVAASGQPLYRATIDLCERLGIPLEPQNLQRQKPR